MKAAVYRGKGKIVIESVPKPRLNADEVLLQVKSVGICGTDLHIYHGGTDVKPGTVVGHEFSGVVAAVGRQVNRVKVGDRVVAEHNIKCGDCYYCVRGKPNLCERREVLGVDRPGALAEYMAIPADLVFKIPKSMSFDVGAMIEPLTIAVYAISNAGPLLQQRVAVVGQGPIGLLLDQTLKAAGATVIGIDVLPHRLAFARRCGWVDHALNPKAKDFRRQLKRLAPLGVDLSFEAVGKEVTADLTIDITRRDGLLFWLGVFEKPATISAMKLVKKELNVNGSWTCAFAFPPAIELVAEQKVDLKRLVTHRYRFEEVARAFAEASQYSDNRIKSIVTFD